MTCCLSLLSAAHCSRPDESFCLPSPQFPPLNEHGVSGLRAESRMIFLEPEEDLATCPHQIAMTFHHLEETISVWKAMQECHDTTPISEAHLYPLGSTGTIPQATHVPECTELFYATVALKDPFPQPEISFSFFPWLSAINPSRIIVGIHISRETLPDTLETELSVSLLAPIGPSAFSTS